ncbi:MAG: hypothetical protein Q4F71_04695 [Paracoccus sp. (in: a-proteobacteria)]|nr:hypothetical protein [Paracoccus sp. (in: a-proteobacteria)]
MSDFIVASDVKKTAAERGAQYSCLVSRDSIDRRLTFDVSTTADSHMTARSDDWVLLGLLFIAMRSGKNLRIEGKISPLLLHAARSDIQHLLRRFDKTLHHVDIDAEVCSAAIPTRDRLRVGSGFSAGIDSFAAVGSFKSTGLTPDLIVTDLFTFNVGAIGGGNGNNVLRAFRLMVARAEEYASATGALAHSVNSNLHTFYTGHQGLEFPRTHTLRNMAAASLFQSEIDCYLYASTFSYAEIDLGASYDLAHVDPILLPLLSPAGMRYMSASAGINRVEKTRLVAQDLVAQELLDVCVAPTAKRAEAIERRMNCSSCWKCYRTMMTLDALGELEKFSQVFDLAAYRAKSNEIVQIIKRRGAKGSTADQSAYDYYAARKLPVSSNPPID